MSVIELKSNVEHLSTERQIKWKLGLRSTRHERVFKVNPKETCAKEDWDQRPQNDEDDDDDDDVDDDDDIDNINYDDNINDDDSQYNDNNNGKRKLFGKWKKQTWTIFFAVAEGVGCIWSTIQGHLYDVGWRPRPFSHQWLS